MGAHADSGRPGSKGAIVPLIGVVLQQTRQQP